jgi:terminal uridylyltransferase
MVSRQLKRVDMDLVVLIDDENAGLDSGHFVQMMGDLLERVSFNVRYDFKS